MEACLHHYTPSAIQIWAVFIKNDAESVAEFEARVIEESKKQIPNCAIPKNNNFIEFFENRKLIKSISTKSI